MEWPGLVEKGGSSHMNPSHRHAGVIGQGGLDCGEASTHKIHLDSGHRLILTLCSGNLQVLKPGPWVNLMADGSDLNAAHFCTGALHLRPPCIQTGEFSFPCLVQPPHLHSVEGGRRNGEQLCASSMLLPRSLLECVHGKPRGQEITLGKL